MEGPLETIGDAASWLALIAEGVQTGDIPPGMAKLLKELLHEFVIASKVLDEKDPRKIAQEVATAEIARKAVEQMTPEEARLLLMSRGLLDIRGEILDKVGSPGAA